MESVGSNSPDPSVTRRHRRHKPPVQALADRIYRALHDPLLLLLRRSNSTFFVMGSTSNVYNVVLTDTPTCSCPDRATRCKHILFVLIRVLGVPPNDPSHRRRTLRPCHLSRLLATATSPDSLARPALRRIFHEIFFRAETGIHRDSGPMSQRVEVEEGACCPVCLEEMGGRSRERLVACRRCRNPVHEECLMRWKRSLGRRWASCVVCRARWRNGAATTEKYLNLAAYLREEDDRAEVAGVGGDAGVDCSGG